MNDPDLISASKARDSGTVRALLLTGTDPDIRDSDGETALTWAAYLGHTPVVKDLLAGGADLSASGKKLSAPPLVLAAAGGHYGIVALLSVLADVDAADSEGATALMRAIGGPGDADRLRRRALDVLHRLLEAGADPNKADPSGDTPLVWALRAGSAEAARLLLAAGADPEHKNRQGENALDVARREGMAEALYTNME